MAGKAFNNERRIVFMKKALAMTLGALLVAGSAAPAFAASQIDFSGYYRTIFANQWNQSLTGKLDRDVTLPIAVGDIPAGTYPKGTDFRTNDSYFVNRLHLDFGFHATDEVSVYWALRAPSAQRWGGQGNAHASGNLKDDGTLGATTYHAYGEVKQDWGTVSIGRLNAAYSYLGLASVGYDPGGVDSNLTAWGIYDLTSDPMDGIRFANRWDSGFQLVAQFNRLATGQYYVPPVGYGDEESSDLFILQPSFHWDTGAASLAMIYLHDQANQVLDLDIYAPSTRAFLLNPAFAQSFGDLTTHFEAMLGWGKIKALKVGDPTAEDKASGYSFYLDLDYNYGPGNVMLAGWWASGTGKDDTKIKSLVSPTMSHLGQGGDAFVPFLVAYGDGALYGRQALNAVAMANAFSGPENIVDALLGSDSNHWALALNGGHAFTDDLTLKYTLGYLSLNKVREGAKKDIGWEADLGLQVNLLDNLGFRTTAGYLFAGKALDAAEDMKAKDAYSWYNTLIFRF